MLQRITHYVLVAILLLTAVVSIWFLVDNLQRLEPALYAFTIVAILALVLFLYLFAHGFTQRLKETTTRIVRLKYFNGIAFATIIVLGIVGRFSFYFKFSYQPTSDPLVFNDAAQKIANGVGLAGDNYTAFFPHLAAYDTLLGITMKIITNPWLAAITLNTVFDIGAAILIYILVRRLVKPASKLPILALTVWFLSPFNILFSVLSLPIVIVNFFIIAMIYFVYLLDRSIVAQNVRSTLIVSIILGITIGLGNCFRPIFSIAIIALFLLFLFILVIHKSDRTLLLLLGCSFVVVVVLFFGAQKLNDSFVATQTGLEVSDSAGWNIYVGSNSESDGTWNQLDQDRERFICKSPISNVDCQAKLEQAGIDRYKQQGLRGTLNLFVRKLYRFSSDQSTVYNANNSIKGYTQSRTAKLMGVYTTVYMALLFIFSTKYLYFSSKQKLAKQEIEHVVLFISILMLGLFFSSVLVETSPRYAQVVYPLFAVFAVLGIGIKRTVRK